MNMPLSAIVSGALLIALGLYSYFTADADGGNVSVTALIPAFAGAPVLLAGLVALIPKLRMHAMHVAVLIALLGGLAAAGKGAMGATADTPNTKALVAQALMAIVCFGFVGVAVNSFIQARRRQTTAQAEK